ncbi:MAG: cation-translocating P-type ATPase [Culicoidibacterales bacterium]
MSNFYAQNPEDVIEQLAGDLESGLTAEQVRINREKYGTNELPEEKQTPIWLVFLGQFKEPLTLILIAVAIISFLIGEWKETIIIAVIVIFNALIDTVQQAKARKSLAALKQMAAPKAYVRRDGQTMELESSEIVIGDVVILDAGRFVPADMRIIEASNLQINESALTGESVPVEKQTAVIPAEEVALGDQVNMAFMSTLVTNGRGIGIVTGTGIQTEIGKIADLMSQQEESETPLQIRLASLSKIIAIIAFVLAVTIFCIDVFIYGSLANDWREALITASAVGVAVIPESLPVIVSVILALGVGQMAKKHAIVKKLPSVETLGSVNVICSDKTGTLTQNRMTVTEYYANQQSGLATDLDLNVPENQLLLQAMILCSDAEVTDHGEIGDPTEIALVDLGRKFSQPENEVRAKYPRIDELPFDSDRKMMSTVNTVDEQNFVFTKGGVDQMLKRTTRIIENGQIRDLTEADIAAILAETEKKSKEALRVLGFAYKLHDPEQPFEENLVFIGLVGMIDPPREEVKAAIARASAAGIKTVMITGDHKITAVAIAHELGIADSIDQAMEGSELNQYSDEQLKGIIPRYNVFARVSPEHKVRIVKALQANELVVSMTGDGVNDAPSLSAADVGVAMGITGTDVAKGAADMILTDDNFATIVNAVEEGRNIYNKIKRAVLFVLTTIFGEALVILVAVILGLGDPLAAVHVLWINLIVESLIAIPMGMDISRPDVMEETPRHKNESIFAGIKGALIAGAAIVGATALATYFIGLTIYPNTDGNIAQTMTFFVTATAPLFYALSIRLPRQTVFSKHVFENKNLLIAIAIGLVMNILLVITPANNIMKLTPMTTEQWLIVAGMTIIPTLLMEAAKLIMTRKK